MLDLGMQMGSRRRDPDLRHLFRGSIPGLWYDLRDLSTLYQDSTGTTPVTGVEQPLGLVLDKSGNGYNGSQPTSTARPKLSSRYNMLRFTEDFSNAAWVKSGCSITLAAAAYVDGTDAHTLTINEINEPHYTRLASVYTGSGFVSSAFVDVKMISPSGRYVWIGRLNSSTPGACIDLTDLSVLGEGVYTQDLGGGWIRLGYDAVTAGGSGSFVVGVNSGLSTTLASFLGDESDAILIKRASLVPANQSRLPYQRVGNSPFALASRTDDYDWDFSKFPQFAEHDGVDDNTATAAGGGSTTGFFYCNAVKVGKVGAAQTLFSDTGTNTGYRVRINASNKLELAAGNGSAYTTIETAATLAIGQIAVLTAWHDGVNLNVQINNGTVASTAFATATAGTAAITIGKDNGAASSYFLGGMGDSVYPKNSTPSAYQREAAKRYMAAKYRVTL